jgi:hypothetical protein
MSFVTVDEEKKRSCSISVFCKAHANTIVARQQKRSRGSIAAFINQGYRIERVPVRSQQSRQLQCVGVDHWPASGAKPVLLY